MEGSSFTDHSKLKIKLRLVPKHEQQKVNHNENQDLVNPMANSSRATPAPVPKQEEEDWEEGEIRDDEDGDEVAAGGGGGSADEEDQGGDDVSNSDDVEDEEKVKGKEVVCVHCNKVFSGGKALGGHSRVHTANYKNEQNNKKRKRGDFMGHLAGAPISRPESGVGDGGELLFRCTLCPKEFPSEKSLYGHMRSHPEREYRGMKPPPDHHRIKVMTEVGESSSAWASTLSSLAELRLRRLWTWSITGKRGRKASSPEISSSSASYDSHAVVAAENLVMLSSEGNSSPDDDEEDDEEDEESKAKRVRKGKGLMKDEEDEESKAKRTMQGKGLLKDYDSDELYFLKKMGLLIDDSYDDNGMDDDDDMFSVDVNPIRMISPPPSSSTKPKGGNYNGVIKKIKELGSSIDNQNNASNYDEENNVWVCLTCGKTFPTHQALGGHRSSHNKEKTRIGNGALGVIDVGDNGGGVSDGGGGGSGSREDGQVANEIVINNFNANDDVTQVTGLHKCKLCDKTFATGQALGGHQRCHYVPSLSSSPETSNAQTGRRDDGGLEIDLNVSLPMVENDDAVESGGRD